MSQKNLGVDSDPHDRTAGKSSSRRVDRRPGIESRTMSSDRINSLIIDSKMKTVQTFKYQGADR